MGGRDRASPEAGDKPVGARELGRRAIFALSNGFPTMGGAMLEVMIGGDLKPSMQAVNIPATDD